MESVINQVQRFQRKVQRLKGPVGDERSQVRNQEPLRMDLRKYAEISGVQRTV